MRQLLISIAPFLALSALFLFTGFFLILMTEKNALHFAINQMVDENWNHFFRVITHLGDGITAIILIVITAFFTKQKLANLSFGVLVFATSGLLTQFLKRFFFSDIKRPLGVFQNHELNWVPNIDLHTSFSFPSGHSTTAFATFIVLAFYFRKQSKLQILFAFLAIITAFSRVYLSQHFTEDIVTGGFIGIITFVSLFMALKNVNFFKKAFEIDLA